MYYDLFDHDTLASRTHFVHFCGIYCINDRPWISLRSHLRSMIFAAIESACMTAY